MLLKKKKRKKEGIISRAHSLELLYSLIFWLSPHAILDWQLFPKCCVGESLLMCNKAQKRAVLSRATAGSISVCHCFLLSLLRRWQGLMLLKWRKDSSTTVCPNNGSLCLRGCLMLLQCWAAVYCSSAYLMKWKLNLIFFFYPRGGEPCKPWGGSFVFFRRRNRYPWFTLWDYVTVLWFIWWHYVFSPVFYSWSPEHWTCKVLENLFPLQKQEIAVAVHYPYAVFVMRIISSETAVRVWQFHMHLR